MTNSTSIAGPVPLRAFPLFQTQDPVEFERDIERMASVERRRVRLARSADPFAIVANGTVLEGIQVFGVAFSAGASVRSDPVQGLHIMIPVQGSLGFRGDDGAGYLLLRDQTLVFSPLDRVELEWRAGTVARGMRVGNAVLTDFLRESFLIDAGPAVRFLKSDVHGCGLGSFGRILALLMEELEVAGKTLAARCGQQWLDLLLMALLQSVPNSLTAVLDSRLKPVPDARLRRTIDYIEGNLDRPIRMRELVAAAGGSARALQAAFRARFGLGPMTYVRNRRLDRVRDELACGSRDSTTVSDVAARWGFYNLSHFSHSYRRRFGELPSEHLRRSS